MRVRGIAGFLVLATIAANAHSAPACDPDFNRSYEATSRVVDSLRPEKPGALRVFSADDLRITAGQAMWMQGQLRGIARACTQGDITGARTRLGEVQTLLRAAGSH